METKAELETKIAKYEKAIKANLVPPAILEAIKVRLEKAESELRAFNELQDALVEYAGSKTGVTAGNDSPEYAISNTKLDDELGELGIKNEREIIQLFLDRRNNSLGMTLIQNFNDFIQHYNDLFSDAFDYHYQSQSHYEWKYYDFDRYEKAIEDEIQLAEGFMFICIDRYVRAIFYQNYLMSKRVIAKQGNINDTILQIKYLTQANKSFLDFVKTVVSSKKVTD